MAGYCDFSDLPTDSCAHCKRGLKVLPQVAEQDDRDWHGPDPGYGMHNAPASPGRWFAAHFTGRCNGCEGHIVKGDMIRDDGTGGWACENCG